LDYSAEPSRFGARAADGKSRETGSETMLATEAGVVFVPPGRDQISSGPTGLTQYARKVD
jgi:hypothetical protein